MNQYAGEDYEPPDEEEFTEEKNTEGITAKQLADSMAIEGCLQIKLDKSYAEIRRLRGILDSVHPQWEKFDVQCDELEINVRQAFQSEVRKWESFKKQMSQGRER